jgi:hypothetical protein
MVRWGILEDGGLIPGTTTVAFPQSYPVIPQIHFHGHGNRELSRCLTSTTHALHLYYTLAHDALLLVANTGTGPDVQLTSQCHAVCLSHTGVKQVPEATLPAYHTSCISHSGPGGHTSCISHFLHITLRSRRPHFLHITLPAYHTQVPEATLPAAAAALPEWGA